MTNGIGLLPGERVIMSSDNDILVLTNMRVRYHNRSGGQTHLVSMTLDSIGSVGMVSKSTPAFLIIAAVFAIIGFVSAGDFGEEGLMIALLVAAVFVVLYFITRQTVIAVTSKGGSAILAPATGLGDEACLKFIHRIENEKLLQAASGSGVGRVAGAPQSDPNAA